MNAEVAGTTSRGFVEWAARGRALAGQRVSGDAHLVDDQGARVLLVLVDGLGHGPDAAKASQAAIATLTGFTGDVAAAFAACDSALNGTRGVAMSIAALSEDGTLSWSGIGNVEAFVLHEPRTTNAGERAREHLTLRGGVVGARATPARVSTMALSPGDVVVFATDGITAGAAGSIARHATPATIADDLLAGFAKATDDAHVLIARYVGVGVPNPGNAS